MVITVKYPDPEPVMEENSEMDITREEDDSAEIPILPRIKIEEEDSMVEEEEGPFGGNYGRNIEQVSEEGSEHGRCTMKDLFVDSDDEDDRDYGEVIIKQEEY